MRAVVYKIRVCEGIMDAIHGGGYDVEEVCIPELGLAVNKQACFCMSSKEMDERYTPEKDPKIKSLMENDHPAVKVNEFDIAESETSLFITLAGSIRGKKALEKGVRDELIRQGVTSLKPSSWEEG